MSENTVTAIELGFFRAYFNFANKRNCERKNFVSTKFLACQIFGPVATRPASVARRTTC